MIYDVYVQIAVMELSFYIVFRHMTNVKKNYRWLFGLSYVIAVVCDIAVRYGYRWLDTKNAYLFPILHTMTMMISFIIFLMICEDNWWKICTAIAVSDLLGGISHMLVAASSESTEKVQMNIFPELSYLPYGVLLGSIGFLILFLILRKYLVRFSKEPMEQKIWVRVFAFFYMANMFFAIAGNVTGTLMSKQNLAARIGVSIIFIMVLLLLLYYDYQQKLQQQRYYLVRQNRILQEHYEALKSQIAISRQFPQNVSNMFMYLNGSVDSNEVAENIPEMEWTMLQNSTGKEVLDQVLVNKLRICQEYGIVAQVDIGSMYLDEINEMDIVILLYNILDNAIESCMKISDISERWIRLNIGKEDGKFIIRCENAREGRAILAKGHRTWKHDKKLHGTGMEIMRDITKKYHGKMQYEEKTETFLMNIILY